MPTGYTSYIEDGVVTNLKDFAMLCARAFGALIDMRDEPTSTPIPKLLKPSRYHKDGMDTKAALIARLKARSTAGWRSEYGHEVKRIDRDNTKSMKIFQDKSARYEKIRKEIEAWKPPKDHVQLKAFMLDQIRISTEHMDAYTHHIAPFAEWKALQIHNARTDWLYHKQEWGKELARVKRNNAWVAALRASLEATHD